MASALRLRSADTKDGEREHQGGEGGEEMGVSAHSVHKVSAENITSRPQKGKAK
jgi:hypothetical protein